MLKKTMMLLSAIIILSPLVSCKKSEQPPEPKRSPVGQGPIIDTQPLGQGHGGAGKKIEFQVVVPPEVKEKWIAVVIVVDDKKEKKQEEFTVNIGGEFKIPDSNLTVKIGPFLPDFKMSADTITSASAEPNNPSVGIAVIDNGSQLFPATGKWGWLYSKFPTIHSFQHERFSLTLKGGRLIEGK
jgi:hypothetical protein